jgi:Putative amidoligase enzyme
MPEDQVEETPLVSPCDDCGESEQTCTGCERCDDCGCECNRCPHCNTQTDEQCERCENCDSCCTCETCSYGRRSHRVENTCESCGYCSDHCECYVCGTCGDRVTEYCGACERCEGCGCRCDGDSPRFDGHFQYMGTATKAMPRYTSLELEYNGCDDGSYVVEACRQWADYCVSDGSLPDEGFEINTNPSRGDTYDKHIRAICSAVQSAGSEVTRCCGLHVHVDARDLNWHDLYKLSLLYMRVEDALFKMQPSSRQDNRYCMRVESNYKLDPKGYKHKLLNRLYDHSFPEHKKQGRMAAISHKGGKRVFSERTDKYNSARYYAMNLHTFFYRGTIEFRHASSTTKADKAINWGLVCMWIVERASKMTVAQINALHEDSTVALCSILPADVSLFVCQRQLEQGR